MSESTEMANSITYAIGKSNSCLSQVGNKIAQELFKIWNWGTRNLASGRYGKNFVLVVKFIIVFASLGIICGCEDPTAHDPFLEKIRNADLGN